MLVRHRHRLSEMLQQQVAIGPHRLAGEFIVPDGARGLIVFAHGSGSSRLSPRNRFVGEALHRRRLGTLLFDLLTPVEAEDRVNVFNIPLLGARLVEAVQWCRAREQLAPLAIGIFGASTGAAAALVAAAERPQGIFAVVSRGGRPDLAGAALRAVRAPTLLIVGGDDPEVLALNEDACRELTCEKRLDIVPGATHLFEESGTLECVARLAGDWFAAHLVPDGG